jgi:acetyl-CoA acetyltransferase
MPGKVAIIGAGSTAFKARWIEKTYYELAFEAARLAFEDAGIRPQEVDAAVYGIYNEFFERQGMPEIYIHDYLGLGLKASCRVTAGGATGGMAVRAGYLEVASGLHDVVLVLGVEKCADCYSYEAGSSSPEILKAITTSADMTFEVPLGLTPAASYALPTVAHMERYGSPTEEQMAKVAVKNHRNAKNNPLAQSPKDLTVEEVLLSPMICYPFKRYDNCLHSEGATAVILASEETAKKRCPNPAWITGVGIATDMAFPGNRPDLTVLASSVEAGRRAYRMAGIRDPRRELDFAEVHDAFTAAEILSYEALGFCGPGEGGTLIDTDVTEMMGDLPVNPSGGLIGCGHAIGASGVMQVMEAALQVRGRAGARQVPGARRGLVQSVGGPATTYTVVLIIEKGGH